MDKEEQNKLVEQYIPLAKRIAGNYMNTLSQQEYEDIFQTGCIGLIKAANSFDSSKGSKFISYAYKGINLEIKNYLKKLFNNINSEDLLTLFDFSKEDMENLVQDDFSQEDNLIQKESLNELFTGLNEKEKKIISMKYLKNMTGSQIAEKYGFTRQYISIVIKGALQKVKNNIDKEVDHVC